MSTVLLYSGGVDSTALLWDLRSQKEPVLALGFDYGQGQRIELDVAERLAARAGAAFRRVAVPPLGGPAPRPHGPATIVPNRNMVMLSAALAVAVSERYSRVAMAIHAGDSLVYPDCRPEWVRAARELCLMWGVDLVVPYIFMSKKEVVARGRSRGAPLEETYSCYAGGEKHCGRCGACVSRAEAGL